MLWTLAAQEACRTLSTPPGRLPPKKVAADTCSTVNTTAKVCSPAPAPRHQSHHDHRSRAASWQLWRASGPGAAVGRLCCQPAAPAAGWAQVLGFCRLACPQAALWRFRSRARPRPLIGSCGRGFLGRGRSAVVALHLSPTRSWRRIGHLRCWGEAHAASHVRGRRCRPAGSALARVDPVSGAEEPWRGGSRGHLGGLL